MAENPQQNSSVADQPPANQDRFDPNFTQSVIDAIGPNCTPRNRQIFTSLLKHLHDFAREVELTIPEWMAGQKWLDAVGHMYFTSNFTRHEMHRISDITGLESLVDEIAHHHAAESGDFATSTTILGPFWSPNAPFRDLGASTILSPHEGMICLMKGKITNIDTGKGIPGAVVDIWQASSNGKYDFQEPGIQEENNLRGKFRCDDNGDYHFYCLKPTAYSLPQDGPSWELLQLLDRHPMRPAHIHLMVTADNYKQCVTQIFPSDDPWVKNDTVFAVKPDLVFDFTDLKDDPKGATKQLICNVTLAKKGFGPEVPEWSAELGK